MRDSCKWNRTCPPHKPASTFTTSSSIRGPTCSPRSPPHPPVQILLQKAVQITRQAGKFERRAVQNQSKSWKNRAKGCSKSTSNLENQATACSKSTKMMEKSCEGLFKITHPKRWKNNLRRAVQNHPPKKLENMRRHVPIDHATSRSNRPRRCSDDPRSYPMRYCFTWFFAHITYSVHFLCMYLLCLLLCTYTTDFMGFGNYSVIRAPREGGCGTAGLPGSRAPCLGGA